MVSYLKDCPNTKVKKWFYGILIGNFIFFFLVNCATFYIADDYAFHFVAGITGTTGAKLISSFQDAFNSAWTLYFTWGGRFVSYFCASLFLWLPKIVFNFVNSIFYSVFIFCLYILSKSKTKVDILQYSFIVILVWLINPVFGQSFLWVTGACVYLWVATFILIYLVLLKEYFAGRIQYKKIGTPILFSVIGFLAGMSLENLVVAAIFYVIFFLGKLKYDKKKIPAFIWTSFGFMVFGAGLLILAPGSAVRMTESLKWQVPDTNIIFEYLHRFSNCLAFLNFTIRNEVFAAGAIIGLMIAHRKHIDIYFPIYLFIVAAISAFSMIASPEMNRRIFFGSVMFLIILFGYAFDYYKENVNFKTICTAIFSLLLVWTIIDVSYGLIDLLYQTRHDLAREKTILQQKALGNLNPVVDNYAPQSKYNPAWDSGDLTNYEGWWQNVDVANYYGLESITVK